VQIRALGMAPEREGKKEGEREEGTEGRWEERKIRVRANLCRRKSTVTLDWKLSRGPEHVPASIPSRSCQTINLGFIACDHSARRERERGDEKKERTRERTHARRNVDRVAGRL